MEAYKKHSPFLNLGHLTIHSHMNVEEFGQRPSSHALPSFCLSQWTCPRRFKLDVMSVAAIVMHYCQREPAIWAMLRRLYPLIGFDRSWRQAKQKPFLSFSLSSLQKRAFYVCVAFLLPHITIMLLDLGWEIQQDQSGLSCGSLNPLFTSSSYTYSVFDPSHKSHACNVKEILVKCNF